MRSWLVTVARRPGGGGGRERPNSEAITEAIRPCNPQGAFGARRWHTRSTHARPRCGSANPVGPKAALPARQHGPGPFQGPPE